MSKEERAELSRDEMEKVLAEEEHGCLCLARESEPYAVPISYAFLDGNIVLHCAREGLKLDYLRANSRACFSVSRCPKPIAPHDGKCHFPYESVLCFGAAREVTEPEEKARWLTRFKLHFYTRLGLDSTPLTPADVNRTCCVVMAVERMTGRRKALR